MKSFQIPYRIKFQNIFYLFFFLISFFCPKTSSAYFDFELGTGLSSFSPESDSNEKFKPYYTFGMSVGINIDELIIGAHGSLIGEAYILPIFEPAIVWESTATAAVIPFVGFKGKNSIIKFSYSPWIKSVSETTEYFDAQYYRFLYSRKTASETMHYGVKWYFHYNLAIEYKAFSKYKNIATGAVANMQKNNTGYAVILGILVQTD